MTNKQRKLAYIREKNHIRRGGKITAYTRVSNELLQNTEFIEVITNDLIKKTIKSCKNKYKLDFEVVDKMVAENGLMDCVENMKTIIIDIKRVIK